MSVESLNATVKRLDSDSDSLLGFTTNLPSHMEMESDATGNKRGTPAARHAKNAA